MDRRLRLDNAFSDLFTRRKLVLLLLSWIACIVAMLSYRTLVRTDVPLPCPGPADLSILDGNETGAFVSWRKAEPSESQPECRVQFDNLRAENGHLGFFRTASNKTANIDNLRVTFLQPDASDGPCDVKLDGFCDLFAPQREDLNPIGVLSGLQGEAMDCSISVDLTNTTLVQVRDMVWEIRCGDQTVLKVQCRRACLRGDTPYVLLQGHAIVTTPAAKLEGNCIKMNVRDNCFVVDGRYLLTRNGNCRNGVGGCFDTELRPYQVASSDGKAQEEWMHGYSVGVY